MGACIASVPFARAWVMDGGSTDGTVDAARRAGATVIEADWPGFVAQRNRALALGDAPFQLVLDADEQLSAAARADVLRVLTDPGDAVAWSFPRATTWAGRTLAHGRAWPDRQVRLFRRGAGRWAGDGVHERLVVDGRIAPLAGPILHAPYRTLQEHAWTVDRYSRLHADALRARGVRARPWTPAVRASWSLLRALIVERGLLDGPHGVGFAVMGAAHTGLKWHRVRRP